ncbi:MAG: hypothetical protein IJU02_07160 [Lachnospiraceae bacterium]|nr:hypothetical protein [Lachnospiraceae bacterium]
MEGLSLDNILDEEGIDLFNDVGEQKEEHSTEEEKQEEKKDSTTEINPEELFAGESEGVGSEEKNNEEQRDTPTVEGSGTSPDNFFSSIAEAFAEEGIFPDLDDKTIKSIKNAEDFRKVVNDYIQSELDEQQKRIKEALDDGVQPSAIKQYEGILNYLDSIKEEDITAESEQAEEIRKRIIFQDFINRGFDQARAEKEVNKSIQNGTDIEDAKDALKGCRTFYKNSYNDLLSQAKKDREEAEADLKKRAEQMRDSMLDSKNGYFDDLEIDKNTRLKAYDAIMKPVYRDKDSGETLTAIQKYEREHKEEFLAKIGLLFTLTEGFKSIDKLVDKKAKKAIQKGFKDLEGRINSTARDSYGNLKFTSGVDDSESYLGKGIKLAL